MLARHCLPALLLVIASAAARAVDSAPLQTVAQQLQFHGGVEGDFLQRKQLPFMHSPLLSRGVFSFAPGTGLRWQITEPVASMMTVRDGVVTLDGEQVQDNGVGRLMARILGAFMGGDPAEIEEDFAVEGGASDAGWELVLTPRGVLLSQVLASVQLAGDAFLRRIEIVEQTGSVTRIEFANAHSLNVNGAEKDPVRSADAPAP